MRLISTESLKQGVIDSMIREAEIMVSHCERCDRTGREGEGDCLVCSPMRRILKIIETAVSPMLG